MKSERDALERVLREVDFVEDDAVVAGCACALNSRVARHVEVVRALAREALVDDKAGRHVSRAVYASLARGEELDVVFFAARAITGHTRALNARERALAALTHVLAT